jgi:CspA family cold shock protein
MTTQERYTGRVKWFNNKAGYGFITVTDGAKSGSDIFTHHSAINVGTEQYKYLVQGEYVEFELTSSETHQFQASNVSGIRGGKLMCETRHDTRKERVENNSQWNTVKPRGNQSVTRPQSRPAPNQSRPSSNNQSRPTNQSRPSSNNQSRPRQANNTTK